MSSLLFPVYKLSRENAHPGNMCDIVFEKVQGRSSKVNRTSAYAEAEFTKKHLCRNLYFDKVKLCRSAASLKSSF